MVVWIKLLLREEMSIVRFCLLKFNCRGIHANSDQLSWALCSTKRAIFIFRSSCCGYLRWVSNEGVIIVIAARNENLLGCISLVHVYSPKKKKKKLCCKQNCELC